MIKNPSPKRRLSVTITQILPLIYGVSSHVCRMSDPAGPLARLQDQHLRWVQSVPGRCLKVPPLEPLTASGAVRELLAVGLTHCHIIEEHPLVLTADPPDLSPDFMLLLTRATQHGH